MEDPAELNWQHDLRVIAALPEDKVTWGFHRVARHIGGGELDGKILAKRKTSRYCTRSTLNCHSLKDIWKCYMLASHNLARLDV